jgi:predicted ATPase/class 3 adenylate cyclase
MAELPSGTVTFLFSDVEGSTRLLARLRGRYADVLGEHHRLLRAAFDEHDGREVHTEGDAFFVAFARASDAIAAAVSAQRALASRRWPEGVDVRVRMGVHTGEADVRLDDYVGLDVHRAARICAAGHGGQVLISGSTRELVADELPADVALKDLGEHGLKDLDRPEHLFQLVVGDLPADFPALASVSLGSGGANGLPPSPNATIGRAEDVQAIVDRLRLDGVRLLTLTGPVTGPGGVGKTRLGLEAARAVRAEFAAGACFVSLAAVRRADDVPAAIVRSLGIVPVSGEGPEQAVTRFLSAKQLLLLLDNVEHVLAVARFVSELLSACPALSVLATSREPLALAGEQRYPVAPLALPLDDDDDESLARVPAVALFCERARAHDPDFRLGDANAIAVAEICRRVDGLPLAIELAAGRCALLSPGEIAERLRVALGVLGAGPRDAPTRHQTLRATIDWSVELLSDAEKVCFARFAVFAGGATVEAAEAITGADLDTLDRLVAKSLLIGRPHAHAATRLWMLETTHAYAIERLAAAADTDAIHGRHYRHYLALAQEHGTDRALMRAGRTEHLAGLDAEIDNLHAALAWAAGQDSAEASLELGAALGSYWLMRSRPTDALHWIDRALSLPGADAHSGLRVRALLNRAWCLFALGRTAEQPAAVAQAEALARELGDLVILSQALQTRADYESGRSRLDVAAALADEALRLASTAGDEWEIARAARAVARAASTATGLGARVDRAAELLNDVGNLFDLGYLLTSAAYVALREGCDRDARDFAKRALPVVRELDHPFMWMNLQGNLALAALLTDDTDTARDAFREALVLSRQLVVPLIASEALLGLAALDAMRGDTRRAARLVGAATAHRYDQSQDLVNARLDAAFLEDARTRCGADTWDAAMSEGATLSLEDAIAYALQEPRA